MSDRCPLGYLFDSDLVISIKPNIIFRLANKQDIPNAMDEVDLCEKLSLEAVVNANKCPCKMVRYCNYSFV